jgi:predicted transcriptional regulator
MSKLQTLTVKVPSALSAKIARLARKRGTSKSVVIREALEKASAAEHPSFTEAAARYVGAASGPGDLSTNPKYMRDYGKGR